MTPDVVVDIGNSRMKWGVCRDRVVDVIRLPLEEVAVWDAALTTLSEAPRQWAVASVNPPALDRFVDWSSRRGKTVVFKHFSELPIKVDVDEPDLVGLDRLFGAIAAKSMAPSGARVITVDMGTAVTVNVVNEDGIFQGGAIMPGPRLMARALNQFTANLPMVKLDEALPTEEHGPGKSTAAAIRLGLECAFGGGIASALTLFTSDGSDTPVHVFLTGGAASIFERTGCSFPDIASLCTIPTLVLEGIRIAAETLP